MMDNVYLNMKDLPRIFSIAPPVRSIANMTNHPYMKCQVIDGLQICVRFHGTFDMLKVNINGENSQVKYPHVFIKRHGEVHQIDDNGTSDSFYFTYAPENAPIIPDDLVISEIKSRQKMHTYIHNIIELLPHSREIGVSDRIDGLCQQLLIELLLEYGYSANLSVDEEKICKISSYLHINFNKDLNFSDIAKHFGYSSRSFYRHWVNYYHSTPAAYVAELKLSEAKRLLVESNLSVEAISEQLRYSSSAYFIFYFRKHTGITPKKYRKSAIFQD